LLDLERRKRGNEHPKVAALLLNIGASLQRRERHAEAEGVYLEALAIQRKTLPAGHPHLAHTSGKLAAVLYELGRPDEAEPLAQESLRIWRQLGYPKGHLNVAVAEIILGRCRLERGDFEGAEELLVGGYHALEGQAGVPEEAKQKVLRNIIDLYEKWGQQDQADRYRAVLGTQGQGPALDLDR